MAMSLCLTATSTWTARLDRLSSTLNPPHMTYPEGRTNQYWQSDCAWPVGPIPSDQSISISLAEYRRRLRTFTRLPRHGYSSTHTTRNASSISCPLRPIHWPCLCLAYSRGSRSLEREGEQRSIGRRSTRQPLGAWQSEETCLAIDKG
jgi:hypothetical protein